MNPNRAGTPSESTLSPHLVQPGRGGAADVGGVPAAAEFPQRHHYVSMANRTNDLAKERNRAAAVPMSACVGGW